MRVVKLSSSEKVFIGAMGGLSAVCVKFLGQDYTTMIEQGANLTADQWFAFKVGYGVLTPILIFLGAILAWVSEESSRVKLLAIALAAPAMITTWSGGAKSSNHVASLNFGIISNAHADEQREQGFLLSPVDPTHRSNKSLWTATLDGVKIFFGYGKDIKHYYVVAGSFKSREDALAHSNAINDRDSDYHAFVGARTANDYYPVLLGEADTLSNTEKVKRKIIGQRIVNDAYLVSAESLKSRMSFAFMD